MARGTQLGTLVDMLKAETGQSVSVSVGVDALEGLKTVLRRQQVMLYDAYDWPFLRVKPTKNLAAGQRYYDFPANIELEGVVEVSVWWGGQPHEIGRGIGIEQYAQYDSDSDQRADPPERWDIVNVSNVPQIEIWPIPVSNDMKLQFIGKRPLRALTADSDVADLDDQLIVLHAKAEILARQKSEDAKLAAQAAAARLNQLKARGQGGSEMISIGGGRQSLHPQRPIVIRVR